MWDKVKQALDYDDDQIEEFKKNPRNLDVLGQSGELLKHLLVFEVVQSHGCASGHRVGDKLYFDGAGNLLTEHAPPRICSHALYSMEPLIYAATELFYAGADPNRMRFKRAGCADVGLACGGWGNVVVECS